MSRRPHEINIYRIAEEAGVSPATVSRVINRRLGVGEETRRKIAELLRRHNFMPDYPAMRDAKIALVTPWEELTDYIRKVLKGVYSYARGNGLAVNVVIFDAKSKGSLLEIIRDQQCSGVIALLSESYKTQLLALSGTDIPTIAIDNFMEDPGLGFIDNDSYSGSCEATRHLLALGHRKIGYLRYSNDSLNQSQRFKGYRDTMNEAGIEIKPNWLVRHDTSKPPSVRGKSGLEGMELLLSTAPELTAVMAVDDGMALGAMAMAHKAGIRIPQELSLVGFDNHPETEVWFPPLTTVNHPMEQAGRLAAESIHSGLRNAAGWTPPRVALPTQLVIRESTGQVKARIAR